MSLDQNLFTLHLTQHTDNPNVVDLVDPSGTVHYRKQRLPGMEYKAEVYDPISQSLLITATSPTATSKAKTLELCNPTILVDLKYTGTLSFRWGFKWEEHDFEWKREECFMLRKPDPPVLVAVTKEPAGRLKTTSVQILDYNLNRFDIDDRKGLEIVILTALLTFQDVNEGYHTPPQEASPSSTPGLSRNVSAIPGASAATTAPPQPPPKPAPKTGVDGIAEMQAAQGEYNEIIVEGEGHVDHYAQYCARLLEDDAMLFVTVKSAAAEQVPKVLQVVEQAKRIRHKAGLADETELHQYVVYDTIEKQKGPRRINLNDNTKPTNTYSPPTSLTVHLSKIDMPELQPQATTTDKPSKDGSNKGKGSKDTSSKDKASKDSKKKEEKKDTRPKTPPQSSRPGGKLSKDPRPSSPTSHIHSHQVHPKQPSPSPSQLNNPAIYTAPPPVRNSSRPQNSRASEAQSVQFPSPTVPNLGTINSGWDRPARHSPHASAGAQSFYGPGAYAPPPNPSPNSGPYTPSYSPGYAPPPSWQQPHAGGPPPSHPPVAAAAPTTPTTQKPSSIVTGLFDSFRRR